MSQHRDLEAQLPLKPEDRSSRLRPPNIAESERPCRLRSLVSVVLIAWLAFMQDVQSAYLYLVINFTDKVRAILAN